MMGKTVRDKAKADQRSSLLSKRFIWKRLSSRCLHSSEWIIKRIVKVAKAVDRPWNKSLHELCSDETPCEH